MADIDQLSFHPTSDWHGDTTFEFSINDDNTADPFIIIIEPINDAPTIVAEKMLETTEDSPLLIFETNSHLPDYSYQDVEDNEWFNIQIVDLPVEGTLKLDGSLLQANATLSVDQIERLEYIPRENWNGENGERGGRDTTQGLLPRCSITTTGEFWAGARGSLCEGPSSCSETNTVGGTPTVGPRYKFCSIYDVHGA